MTSRLQALRDVTNTSLKRNGCGQKSTAPQKGKGANPSLSNARISARCDNTPDRTNATELSHSFASPAGGPIQSCPEAAQACDWRRQHFPIVTLSPNGRAELAGDAPQDGQAERAEEDAKITSTLTMNLITGRATRWTEAWDVAGGGSDPGAAASLLPSVGQRAFLSIGRQDLATFADVRDSAFLIRTVDQLESVPLKNSTCVTGRGPFSEAQEADLLRHHRIDVLVSKNAGGDSTYAKIEAARKLSIPVIMIGRPDPVAGETLETVDDAVGWLATKES